jgi:hypothetical protein
MTKSFTMRSTAPIEFEYIIDILQTHPALSIEPLEGIIPYNKDATVNVTFRPYEFCTAIMTVQLIVSQFNSKPIKCTFYGTSLPGLERDRILTKLIKQSESNKNVKNESNFLIDSDLINEINTTQNKSINNSSKKVTTFNDESSSKDVAVKKENYVDIDGYRFPLDLSNTWNVSKVLMQTRNKLSVKDLRASSKKSTKISAQAKEQIFLQRVNELEDEERKNQLKWQVKLGETLIDEKAKNDILRSRAQAVYEYQLSIGVPFLEIEVERQASLAVDCRTVRDFNKVYLIMILI